MAPNKFDNFDSHENSPQSKKEDRPKKKRAAAKRGSSEETVSSESFSSDREMKTEALIRMGAILKILTAEPTTIHRLSLLMKKTVRTIQRNIDQLRCGGFPVFEDPDTHEFSVVSDYGVPPIEFTVGEALAAVVTLQESGTGYGTPFLEDSRRAALKVAASISPRFLEMICGIRGEISSISAPSEIGTVPNIPRPTAETSRFFFRKKSENSFFAGSPDLFSILLDAIRVSRVVQIRYKSPIEKGEFQTSLHPFVLVWGKRAWYLVGYAGLFGEIRLFKLNRIVELTPTAETFSRPGGFSLEEFLGNAWCLISERGRDEEVILRFSPLVAQNVSEVRWHKTQENRFLPDGSVEIRFLVSGLREVSWWVLGYGSEVEVLNPPALRKMIIGHIRRMSKRYRLL